jgi:hypothetical protein
MADVPADRGAVTIRVDNHVDAEHVPSQTV